MKAFHPFFSAFIRFRKKRNRKICFSLRLLNLFRNFASLVESRTVSPQNSMPPAQCHPRRFQMKRKKIPDVFKLRLLEVTFGEFENSQAPYVRCTIRNQRDKVLRSLPRYRESASLLSPLPRYFFPPDDHVRFALPPVVPG